MSDIEKNQKMLNDVTDLLDKSCDQLDGHTLSRLNKMHHDAFHPTRGRSRSSLTRQFAGIATAVMVIVFIWNQQAVVEDVSPSSAIEDLEILTSSDSLEFYEDFEFYQWLAENESSV